MKAQIIIIFAYPWYFSCLSDVYYTFVSTLFKNLNKIEECNWEKKIFLQDKEYIFF